ncbi:MAG TPA: squalene--hopene cyclase [Candidatus Nitrosotenuis sp.]|jgi:squalene-hopene/tetraprenyl-beta-curcumene cyclase|nr:squalene--hopene cyclase [Candidatus Nitrosotenuis sp.]
MTDIHTGRVVKLPPRFEETTTTVQKAMEAAQRWLLARQNPDGHWVAELEGDTILESEYIVLLAFLGRPGSDPKIQALARYLWEKIQPHGGWSAFPGGPVELSGSVKAYWALKYAGYSPDLPEMRRAREVILQHGGIDRCNSFTKYYLACLGEYPWEAVPAVPPEMVLLPRWFYFNLYAMSSWSRTIVVPLSIIFAHRPLVPVPPHARIQELYTDGGKGPRPPLEGSPDLFSWRNFWLLMNRLGWLYERSPWKPLRRLALERALAWLLARVQKSDGLGAIFPPIVNTVMALRCLGYPEGHPLVQQALHELEKLEIAEGDTVRVQPCKSPVWDTVISCLALLESGLPASHEALVQAASWLLDHEVRQAGDWQMSNPGAPVGGWYFEYANEWYPDNDDTAYVLLALSRIQLPEPLQTRARAAIRRGLDWLLAMQNRDGSWAAFDKDNHRHGLTHMPFADHNAMIDPGTADLTGRVLEMLAAYGYTPAHPRVRRALEFLYREQEPDGSWYGRWGTNYIYGTWQVLKGLRCIGVDPRSQPVQRAADWLRSVQNADGGWGETCASYDDPSLAGRGPSTASQTAWALMGLFSAGDYDSPAVQAGLHYLTHTQTAQGTWEEEWFTGTGFPRVFYLRYHYYRHYFPLFAMGMYLRGQGVLPRHHEVVPLRPPVNGSGRRWSEVS